ncbi:MAG TPA: hypothetical protein VHV79_03190 [Mycobacteriales bacterium]|nr:hypothetical protein [Mycobacteriales bacterium]
MVRRLAAVRRHWLFVLIMTLGAALRALAWAAYQPALFYSDSVNYLANTFRIPNEAWHPPGYPIFLDALLSGHHLAVVGAVQHLLVLADGVAIYLVLLRLGCSRVAATLAATPLLLDAYQVQIEQYVLSEALFETLLTAAVVIAMWPSRDGVRRVDPWRATAVALLIGLSVLVRLDALGLALPLGLWLLWTGWREHSWRMFVPIVAGIVGFALPVAVLLGLRGVGTNGKHINGMSPIWLYSRVAPIANCPHDDLPARLQQLCPVEPLGHRPGPIYYQDYGGAPEWVFLRAHTGDTQALEDFASHVIEHQPLGYARAVLVDFAQQFRPTRAQNPNGPEVKSWQFRLTLTPVDSTKPVPQKVVDDYGSGRARLNLGLARMLRHYQHYGYLPGPVVALLLAFGAGVLAVRRRHPLAPVLLLVLGSAVMAVLDATATVLFSWRYVLPTLFLYPPAAALAWVMLRTPVHAGAHDSRRDH